MQLAVTGQEVLGRPSVIRFDAASTGRWPVGPASPPIVNQPAVVALGALRTDAVRRRDVRCRRCGRCRCRRGSGRNPGLRPAGRGPGRSTAAGRRRIAAAAGRRPAARCSARQRGFWNFAAAAGAGRGRRGGWALFPAAQEELVKPGLRARSSHSGLTGQMAAGSAAICLSTNPFQ